MEKRTLRLRIMVKAVMISLLFGVTGKMYAYDFSAVCSTGQTLYYNITDAENHYVELTHPATSNSYPWSGYTKPTGSIVLPESVEYGNTVFTVNSIGDYAFRSCNGLTGSMTIPNTVTQIGEYAFYECFGLTGSLIIGTSVISIGERAFCQCYFRGSLVLGNSLVSIGDLTFYNCNFTGDLSIPNSVISIGQSAFHNCSLFTSLSLGNSVTTIGYSAFMNCTGFTGSLFIPNSVTTIGSYAFRGCSGFTGNLIIPNSVTYIGDYAFENCNGFTGSLTIGNSVNTIGQSAFYGCNGFTGDLVIPNSVTSIGYSAFYSCSGFSGSLTIGNSLTTINSSTFANCSGFNGSINIGNSVTTIGGNAFGYCSGFSGSVTIPNSVVSIGEGAFWLCNQLSSVNYCGDVAGWCHISFSNSYANPLWFAHNLYIDNKLVTNLIIPETITEIKNFAFIGCHSLTGSLIIPNSVISIGENAFYNCNGLDGSLTIGNSVTTIYTTAFGECSNLEQIVVLTENQNFDSRDNCNAIINSGTNELILGCKNTNIPNSVSSIGDWAFHGCNGFTGSLTIPSSVTTIGNYVFYNSDLASINLIPTTPPSLGNGCFLDTDCSIFVPFEAFDAYKVAPRWSNYQSRIYPMSYKTIPPYNESNNHYRFIASPLVDSIAPTTVDNLITETAYDLYRFNPSDTLGEWQNYKAHTEDFKLVNGQGYLYANENEVNIIFKGAFNEDESKEVNLVYDANDDRKCWNLVGNPFPCNAYLDREYYILTTDGSNINPEPISATTPIPPCTAVFVKAVAEGETVVFTRVAP